MSARQGRAGRAASGGGRLAIVDPRSRARKARWLPNKQKVDDKLGAEWPEADGRVWAIGDVVAPDRSDGHGVDHAGDLHP